MLVTGLLVASSLANASELSQSCKDYFSAIDSFLEEGAKQAGAADQVAMMKTQFDMAKAQISELPEDQQELGCKAGLEGIEQAKQMMAQ